jgi:Protein of unknown function (DUF4019)
MRGGKIIGRGLIGIVLVLNFTTFGVKAEDQQAAAKEATRTAVEWLALVDDEKYKESWDAASPLLRNAVTKQKFAQMSAAARKPLGKLVSRDLKSAQYATSLPGAPDGQYVVIRYATSFENKKSATETITPMLDKDGKWRVSGYYIK